MAIVAAFFGPRRKISAPRKALPKLVKKKAAVKLVRRGCPSVFDRATFCVIIYKDETLHDLAAVSLLDPDNLEVVFVVERRRARVPSLAFLMLATPIMIVSTSKVIAV